MTGHSLSVLLQHCSELLNQTHFASLSGLILASAVLDTKLIVLSSKVLDPV
jgi:hypothetical protein